MNNSIDLTGQSLLVAGPRLYLFFLRSSNGEIAQIVARQHWSLNASQIAISKSDDFFYFRSES